MSDNSNEPYSTSSGKVYRTISYHLVFFVVSYWCCCCVLFLVVFGMFIF